MIEKLSKARTLGAVGTLTLVYGLAACGPTQSSVPAEGDETVVTAGITVEGTGVFHIVGPEGGPFPQGTRTYTVNNQSSELFVFDIETDAPWLVATPIGGIVASGASAPITVTIDHEFAATLPPGDYPADLLLRSRSNVDGELFLAFRLSIEGPPQGELTLNPDDELAITATLGTDPAQVDGTIQVTNTGQAPLDWEAFSDANWLTVQSAGGTTLDPSDSTELQLFVDEEVLHGEGLTEATTQVSFTPTDDPSATQGVSVTVQLVTETDGRVSSGLVAEYRFEEASGNVVHDVSGVAPAMDLVIENPSNTQWIPGGLDIASPTRLATTGAATRINQAVQSSGEITVEAWLRPQGLQQDGPARLISLSDGANLRNFTLGQGLWGSQPKDTFNMRLRATSTDLDGMPLLTTTAGTATGGLQHVVYTRRADGQARLFLDGQIATETILGGDMSNWDLGYRLAVANEIGAERPWLGEMYLLALYDRALSPEEIAQNRSAGSGASNAGQLAVGPQAELRLTATIGQGIVANSDGFDVMNLGGESLQWSAQVDQAWLSLATSNGQLQPTQEVNAQVAWDASMIQALPVGVYVATVDFDNDTSGYGDTSKTVRLTVQNEPAAGSGEKPGPHNTGPSDPSILTPVSGMTITQDGYVLENVRITGQVNVQADNVTIRNFILDGAGMSYGIRATWGHTGILIEDGELINVNSCHIYGGGFTARRLNMHESGSDGFKCTHDVLVEGCWVHHIGTNPGSHADANQTRWGSNFVFRGNFFDIPIGIGAPYKSNACFIMQTGDGPIDNVLIEDNWLTGGNFTVYFENKWSPGSTNPNFGDPTNCRLLNNRFGREFRYGPLNTTGYVEISGNVWDDTGELMDINNQ